MLEQSNKPACTQRELTITQQELPLSCPPRDDRVWDAHPRVYLPIEETGTYTCPYCGTLYRLVGYEPPKVD